MKTEIEATVTVGEKSQRISAEDVSRFLAAAMLGNPSKLISVVYHGPEHGRTVKPGPARKARKLTKGANNA